VIEAQSDQAVLQNGSADITYDLSSDAQTATLVIRMQWQHRADHAGRDHGPGAMS